MMVRKMDNQISDINDFIIRENDTLLQAASKIEKNKARAVLIVSEHKVVGVLSEGDIIRALLRGTNIHTHVNGEMQISFRYLEDRNWHEAFRLFKKYVFSVLPIVNEDMHLVDVITLQSLFNHLDLKVIES